MIQFLIIYVNQQSGVLYDYSSFEKELSYCAVLNSLRQSTWWTQAFRRFSWVVT